MQICFRRIAGENVKTFEKTSLCVFINASLIIVCSVSLRKLRYTFVFNRELRALRGICFCSAEVNWKASLSSFYCISLSTRVFYIRDAPICTGHRKATARRAFYGLRASGSPELRLGVRKIEYLLRRASVNCSLCFAFSAGKYSGVQSIFFSFSALSSDELRK